MYCLQRKKKGGQREKRYRTGRFHQGRNEVFSNLARGRYLKKTEKKEILKRGQKKLRIRDW